MAIIFNDNIRVNAGKPVDAKYLNTGNTSYATISDVNSVIAIPERHIGLTVNISGDEFWYKTGVTNSDLIPKMIGISGSGTITGATNVGFFSGMSGVQTLEIFTNISLPVPNHLDYRGLYSSVLGNFYRDINGIIRVGISNVDSIPKRLYVKTTAPIKSFIWSDVDNGINGFRGWFLMDGDASLRIGENIVLGVDGINYYGNTNAYTNITWNNPAPISGTITAFVTNVLGSLNTGHTTTLGSPVYSRNINNNSALELRTIRSITPTRIGIGFDDAFINISGASINGENIGSIDGTFGNVFSNANENTLSFRRLRGVGNAIVTTIGDDIVINSIAGGVGIAFADNGLTLNNNTIVLGGILRNNTIIDGFGYSGSLAFCGINQLTFESNNFIIRNDDNYSPARYDGNYFTGSSSFIMQHSIPDIQYVTGITSNLQEQINNILNIHNTIEANGGDIVLLPPNPQYKDKITIIDVGGNAGLNPITINGNGRNILGSIQANINTNHGSITIFFNNQGFWSIIGFAN